MASLCLLSSIALADTTVSTSHNDDIYYLGVSDTQTYGQTLTAEGSVLSSYSIGLNNFGATNQDFGFYLATWTGSDVGSLIYSQSLSIAAGSGDVNFTILPSAVVNPGDSYIAFISTSEYTQIADTTISQAGSGDPYLGGGFLFMNNGTDTSQWYSGTWNSWTVPQTAFSATFSTPRGAVPAPTSVFPMLLGLGAMGYRRTKSRRESSK